VTRDLRIPNLQNVRDLGGLPTRDGQTTCWRSVLRADDLHHLAPEGLQALHDYGVETVIDLRWSHELTLFPTGYQTGDANGRRYWHMSLLGASPEAWNERSQNPPWDQWNKAVLDQGQPEVAAALRVIAAASAAPLLFHCVAGKDRTGLVAALLLALADVEPEAIAEDYAASADNLRARWLAGQPEEKWPEIVESLSCPPERIHALLAHLDERYGGPVGYFTKIGLSQPEVLRLRARLRDGAGAP
jgi:protein-tyrosine phosphatase